MVVLSLPKSYIMRSRMAGERKRERTKKKKKREVEQENRLGGGYKPKRAQADWFSLNTHHPKTKTKKPNFE